MNTRRYSLATESGHEDLNFLESEDLGLKNQIKNNNLSASLDWFTVAVDKEKHRFEEHEAKYLLSRNRGEVYPLDQFGATEDFVARVTYYKFLKTPPTL